MNLNRVFHHFACAALAWAIITPGSAEAEMITFTGTGTNSSSEALAATAAFTTSDGHIQVTLMNDLGASDLRSAGQAVSNISFTLSNATTATTLAGTAVGQFGDVSGTSGSSPSKGITLTYVSSDGSLTSPTRWITSPNSGISDAGKTVTLETIGGGKPTEMILPTLANGGTYTNGNNGVQQFNPYVIGPAMFDLDLAGVTANTRITSATFSFGTGPDSFINVIPEPSSKVMVLIGAGSLGVVAFRRRRTAIAS